MKTALLRGTTTDEIYFLAPESLIEDVLGITQENIQGEVQISSTALLRYETDDIIKTEILITDEEPYKGRTRFILPRSSSFFRNRGMIIVWLEISSEATITEVDPDTGEETTITVSGDFITLQTSLFIDEIPHDRRRSKDDENTIRITRGDSLTIDVALTDNDGYPYEPVEGDEALFTVKKSAKAENILIQKNIDLETLEIELVEADTKDLAFGDYVYEVEVITAQDDHYTVIKNAPFIITEELH